MTNAADFAPTGYTLERTDYETGGTRYLFSAPGLVPRSCFVGAADDADAVLTAFKAEALPPPQGETFRSQSVRVEQNAADWGSRPISADAAAADEQPSELAKPSRSRSAR